MSDRRPMWSETEIVLSEQMRRDTLEKYRPSWRSSPQYVKLWNLATNLGAALDDARRTMLWLERRITRRSPTDNFPCPTCGCEAPHKVLADLEALLERVRAEKPLPSPER